MAEGERIAAGVVRRLRDQEEWRSRVRQHPGTAVISFDSAGGLDDAFLQLQPDAGVEEVPVWVSLSHGSVDLGEIEFEPVSAAVVRWGGDHRERGLVAGFPQMLLGPALAGKSSRTPVAGGRRADGLLELWVEPSATGQILAAVDADSQLGTLAELRWASTAADARLLIALAASGERSLGIAHLPVDRSQPLRDLDLLVHPDLSAIDWDESLLSRSASAAISQGGRERWQQLLAAGPVREREASRDR